MKHLQTYTEIECCWEFFHAASLLISIAAILFTGWEE